MGNVGNEMLGIAACAEELLAEEMLVLIGADKLSIFWRAINPVFEEFCESSGEVLIKDIVYLDNSFT